MILLSCPQAGKQAGKQAGRQAGKFNDINTISAVCVTIKCIYHSSGFDVPDGIEILKTTVREFADIAKTGAFQVLQYGVGMLLHALKDVQLDEGDEIPIDVRRKLEVKWCA